MTTQFQRPWREIAEEASHQQDSEKLLALARELLDAFDEQPPPTKPKVT